MAQLNPNFEIDFNDINSYEQIQLINDTQLAKENLLMHRAYKEPSDDVIIQNKFSSFTFVDFCPKLYSAKSTGGQRKQRDQQQQHHQSAGSPEPSTSAAATSSSFGISNNSKSLRCYELETFSDLFERINSWLKLNKEWRVVSMETLVFDCTTQFNHLRSSIHSVYLPKNTRGLRLYLSPSKSRFSGPQRIGCINVVPRKVSGSHTNPRDQPVKFETLDEILARLNELLLNRPIEGRILSVETISLPMVNGYVNTESNYFMDSRLNIINQSIYNVTSPYYEAATAATSGGDMEDKGDDLDENLDLDNNMRTLNLGNSPAAHSMIDILRVYYEFGPMICGLVNLIDFIPRFYSSTPTSTIPNLPSGSGTATPDSSANHHTLPTPASPVANGVAPDLENKLMEKIAATESLTRLIRRSLAWFEEERKRVLNDTSDDGKQEDKRIESEKDATVQHRKMNRKDHKNDKTVDLKCCSLQVCHKIMLKNELIKVNQINALDSIKTRIMAHERPRLDEPITCAYCNNASTNDPIHTWCQHLVDLCQPYEVKFVRLAYVVPVFNKYARTIYPMPRLPRISNTVRIGGSSTRSTGGNSDSSLGGGGSTVARPSPPLIEGLNSDSSTTTSSSSSSSSTASDSSENNLPAFSPSPDQRVDEMDGSVGEQLKSDRDQAPIDLETLKDIEEFEKQSALSMVEITNSRLRENELAHQLGCDAAELNDKPIGQLTYRLFAPCQLVNSSSCFAINPVNSSSPLARRGSVDLNGSGLSSENAHPTPSSLLNPSLTSGSNLSLGGATSNSDSNQLVQQSNSSAQQQVITSFGALFPALTHDLIGSAGSSGGETSKNSQTNSKFTTNEFETVEAIRRRMEVYVTTNSMKVIAGETLIVNLSDVLSCLSTAIEKTIVKASFAQRMPSTWASVYILYAAVEEPLLPGHLLSSQKLRELEQINEETLIATSGDQGPIDAETGEPIFDDDFHGTLNATPKPDRKSSQPVAAEDGANSYTNESLSPPGELTSGSSKGKPEVAQFLCPITNSNLENTDSITIEENQADSSLTLYNSAYDRTVPLPSPPDNYGAGLSEPIEMLGNPNDCLWLDEAELIEVQQQTQKHNLTIHNPVWLRSASTDHQVASNRLKKRKRKATGGRQKRHEDSQCSVM